MDKALLGSLAEVVREDRPPGSSLSTRDLAKTAETRNFGAKKRAGTSMTAAFWLYEVIGADEACSFESISCIRVVS